MFFLTILIQYVDILININNINLYLLFNYTIIDPNSIML